ncbi:hypothetical protein AMS68_004050 [Peltaster fructicola]|uniref:THO complex subunit 2 n=1 Tax=Peltaster fructicola TaxID=286661 RepID=A0A6H0XUX1_9PEZI|nr:hypothetical protein AMS68_004050 [Peltaster fructicola]
MAPGSGKRKRPDNQNSQDGRPSQHDPATMDIARTRGGLNSPRGGRGGGRGGRRGGMHNQPSDSQNDSPAPVPSRLQNHEQTTASPQFTFTPPQVPAYTLPELVDDEPNKPIRPYTYDYLTEDIVATWKETGRQTLLDSMVGQDYITTSVLVQELVRAALDKRFESAEAGKFVHELISKTNKDDLDISSLFIDTISLLDDKDQKRKSLAVIAANTGIDLETFRSELDVSLLQSLGLVRGTFDRMRTRKTTNVLYRQANFNLLREESEGYAKLGSLDYYNTSQEANGETADPEMGLKSVTRVMALVGAFDLDVGRVLDIILDISANSLVKAYRFFMKFFRCSPWWPEPFTVDGVEYIQLGPGTLPNWSWPGCMKWQYPDEERPILQKSRDERDVKFWNQARAEGINAFFELGGRKITNYEAILPLLEQEVQTEADAKGRDITADQRKRINENRKYMKATKMLPPQGNPDAAQLLGFKLRYYASPTRDVSDVMPENLMYLAALLIKIGFVSLRDLYPHLYPTDQDMEQEKERLEKEKQERDRKDRPGGGMNALLMAGALSDDTVPAVRNLRADAAKSGGASPKPDKKDDETDKQPGPPTNQKILLLKALLAIGALPEALYILGKFPWLVDLDPALPRFLHRIVNHMISKVAKPVHPYQAEGWTRETKPQPIDMISNADGSLRLAPRPRGRVRKHLGLDNADNGDGYEERHYYVDWEDNIPVCQTIDDFFALASSFMNVLGVRVGQDILLMVTLIRLTRYWLEKDTSKANVDRWVTFVKGTLLPALSLTKHNPGLNQEMFELLSTFSITVRFRLYEEWYTGKTSRLPAIKTAFDKNRAEVKDVLRRITNQSGKIQARALAKVAFASPGIVMMTFINQLESYSNMIPGLVDSVHYFNPLAFDVLTWVLIRSLSGQGRDRMQADGMLTSAWLQALSQFVASLFTRYSSVNPSPVLQYVASELRKGDSTDLELIDQVIAEMAGIKSDMNFNDVQLIAMTGGEVLQSVTVQQLADNRHKRKSSARRLMKALTDARIVAQMLIAIAQEIHMYAHREGSKDMPLKVLGNNMDKIHEVFAQYLDMLRSHTTPEEFEKVVPDVVDLIGRFGLEPAAAFAISRHIIAHHKTEMDKAQKNQEKDADVVMQDAKQTNGDVTTVKTTPWHPVLAKIVERLPSVTGTLSQRVNMHFYTTFWSLTPQDVHCPIDSYEAERDRLEAQRKEISKDRSDTSVVAIKEREKKMTALEDRAKSLLAELHQRVGAVNGIRHWLGTQKKHWFELNTDESVKAAQHLNLLQECFLPRALYSALDANYCSTLLKILHNNNTPGFSLYALLDQLIRKSLLANIIYSCSAREAENFGRFLCEVLKHLSNWHSSKKTFEHEAYGSKKEHTGFATEFDETGKPTAWLDYEDFRRILFSWHNAVKDAFKICFESKEYMHIRNGIIVLKGVHTVFPALKFHGKAMQDAIKAISDDDPRNDLKLAATSLQGPLKNREKKWVIPQDFKMSEVKQSAGTEQSNGDTEMADADATNKLNAEAPEFKPSSSTNGEGTKASTGVAEDGEIEDEKAQPDKPTDAAMTDAAATTSKDEVVKPQQDANKPSESAKQATDPLPKRPEIGSRTSSQHRPPPSQPNGRHAGRNEDRYGRLDRPSDMRTPLSRSRSPIGRNRDRSTERREDPAGEVQRIRREDRPPLKAQADSRSFRDDAHGRSPRSGDNREHSSLPRGPASQPPHSDRATQLRSELTASARAESNGRAAQMPSVVSQPSVNPARAALINGERITRRESDNNDQRSENAPTGPRAGRNGGSRDLFDQASGRNAGDAGRGRLGRDPGHQAESTYGRLNAGSDASPPARAPNGPARGQRNAQANAPSLNSRASEPNLHSAANRNIEPPPVRNPRQRGPAGDRPSASSSNTDRAQASVPSTPVSESGPAVHPSRLANLGAPAIDTNVPAQGGFGSPAQPPSGPRNQGGRRQPGTPTGPSPTNNLPTGPSAGSERQRRGERPRSNQAPSQPAAAGPNGTQGVQFRGAARQPSHGSSLASVAAAEQPRAIASSMDAPAPAARVDPGRQELIARGQQGNDRGEHQRPSRNSSRERRNKEGPRPSTQDNGARDERGPRGEKRPREDDQAHHRAPPHAPSGFAQSPANQDWNARGPRGYDDRFREGPRGPEEFRAPRRPEEGRREEPQGGPGNHGRKRHSEEGPPFEAKRRRSGR